jgi:hypothetical protein
MDVVDQVRTALAAKLGPAADEIHVSMKATGNLTLSGTVEDHGARADALRAAALTDGVHEVHDHLSVKPELAAEARPKETEFQSGAVAHAIVDGEFDKIP